MADYRPEFEEGLRIFAKVSEAVEKQGFLRPVLVGGAAVEFYSGSAIATGDLDVVTARQDILEKALIDHGFVKPCGRGVRTRGWVHPKLRLGFEVVGTELLDGHADRDRVQLISIDEGEQFAVISVEDLIADRMGQYHSGAAREMLQQAKVLFSLYKDADCTYMEARIREETENEYGIEDLESA